MLHLTSKGVRPLANKAEQRYAIKCLGNTQQARDLNERKLVGMVGSKSPDQMLEMLDGKDVFVTNNGDKNKILPKIKNTSNHVMSMFVVTSLNIDESEAVQPVVGVRVEARVDPGGGAMVSV